MYYSFLNRLEISFSLFYSLISLTFFLADLKSLFSYVYFLILPMNFYLQLCIIFNTQLTSTTGGIYIYYNLHAIYAVILSIITMIKGYVYLISTHTPSRKEEVVIEKLKYYLLKKMQFLNY